jgi:hypothetical protein
MMNKLITLSLLFAGAVFISNCSQKKQEFTPLFNGQNLENWDMYLGSSLGGDFDSLAAAATNDKVFSIVEEEGQKIIRISGEINGSLATRESFENYHLRLVFRWGENVYKSRNSGLLYHSFGDFGAAFGTWMTNIECQLMHENLGDTYLMMNTTCESEAVKAENNNDFIYTPRVELMSFGKHLDTPMIRKNSNQEKPLGEWNTVDLYCFGGTSVHVVNGLTVAVNKNTGLFENGEIKPLSSGKIQIQSEGAELFVKTLEIQNITKLPEEVLPK